MRAPRGRRAGAATFTATYAAATLVLSGDPITVTVTAEGQGLSFGYATERSWR